MKLLFQLNNHNSYKNGTKKALHLVKPKRRTLSLAIIAQDGLLQTPFYLPRCFYKRRHSTFKKMFGV